jgi:hypothetical protein
MSDDMNRAEETPPYGKPDRRIVKVRNYQRRLVEAAALPGALCFALLRRAQNRPTWFMPDGTIKLLPEEYSVNLAALANTGDTAEGEPPVALVDPHLNPFEPDAPQWKPVPMRNRLVGKVRADFTADQYHHPGRRIEQFGQAKETVFLVLSPPPPTPGREVYLYPKGTIPYFDLVTDGETIIDIQHVEMNEDADTEVKRLEIIATLLDDWDRVYSIRYSTFALQARNWRMERRKWEVETLEKIFLTGNLHMLVPYFNINSLVHARIIIDFDNEMERLGKVDVWEGVWNKEGYDAIINCLRQVKKTLLRIKRILFDQTPENERGLARHNRLRMEMYELARLLENTENLAIH